MIIDELFEGPQQCPECGGISFSDLILAEKKDACYYKVKASAKVWPSAYASGRLVQCRKKGAANYGKSKTESVAEAGPFSYGAKKPRKGSVADLAAEKRKKQDKDNPPIEPKDQMVSVAKVTKGVAEGSGNWYVRVKGKVLKDKKFDAIPFPSQESARLKAMEIHNKKRIPLNMIKLTQSWMDGPETQGMAEQQELDEKWSAKYKRSINCANPRGFSQRAHCAGRKKNEDVAETRRGQIPMTLKPGETDDLEPENIAGFRALPAYKQGQAAQQKAGKQLIQKSPYTFQSDQDWAYRQGAFDTQQAAMFANFGKSKPLTTEGGEQQPGADYRDPKEVDYDDEYDAMVARVKKLAGLGPLKTVYDPKRRVYRNMPTAQQPKK